MPESQEAVGGKRNTRFGAIFLIGQTLLLNLFSVPATAYIIHKLGPDAYGQWATASALVATSSCFSSPGLAALFCRQIAQSPETASEALADQLSLRTSLAAVISILVVLLSLFLHYPPVVTLCIAITALGLMLTRLVSAFIDVLQATGHVTYFSVTSFVAGIALTAASLIAVWAGGGAVGLSFAYIVGPLIQAGLLWYLIHRNLFPVRLGWNLRRFRTLLFGAKMVGAKQIVLTVQERLESLVVPKLCGMVTGGYFFAGVMPASRLVIFPDGLSTAWYARIAGAANHESQAKHVYTLMRASLLICLPLAVIIFFMAAPIAQILFPSHAAVCQQVIQITIWAIPMQALSVPMLHVLEASGEANQAARQTVAAAFVSSILSVALMWRLGLVGACASYTVRPLVQMVFLLPVFLRLYPVALPMRLLLRLAACALLMAVPLWLANTREMSLILTLFTGTSAALLAYVAALVSLNVLKLSEIRQMLQRQA